MITLQNNGKLNISNIHIHKRMFEGKKDNSKNDNAITSKYYTSKKFAVSYDIENYEHNPIAHCTVNKKEVLDFIDELKQNHNVTDEQI